MVSLEALLDVPSVVVGTRKPTRGARVRKGLDRVTYRTLATKLQVRLERGEDDRVSELADQLTAARPRWDVREEVEPDSFRQPMEILGAIQPRWEVHYDGSIEVCETEADARSFACALSLTLPEEGPPIVIEHFRGQSCRDFAAEYAARGCPSSVARWEEGDREPVADNTDLRDCEQPDYYSLPQFTGTPPDNRPLPRCTGELTRPEGSAPLVHRHDWRLTTSVEEGTVKRIRQAYASGLITKAKAKRLLALRKA